MESCKLYINGEWVEPISGEYEDVISPVTGKPFCKSPIGDERDTKLAIEASYGAFKEWSTLTALERGKYLKNLASLFEQHRDHLAKIVSIETGKPLNESNIEVQRSIDYSIWSAEEARRVYGESIPSPQSNKRLQVIKQPIGPVAAITPWNFPLSMILRKITPALAAGCTIIMKPAPNTPTSAVEVCKLVEKAGFPPGVINLVLGNAERIGNALFSDKRVKKVTFTGSTKVGKMILSKAANQVKKVSMELGGHAPLIIFDDVNIPEVVNKITQIKFYNSGQTCICPNRIYVHENIISEFISEFKKSVLNIQVGNGLDQDVHMGPLINEQAILKVEEHVNDAITNGAQLVTGGKRTLKDIYPEGNFFEPTILSNITENMKIFNEETFGPVAAISSFATEEEVINKANDTDYGLAAYVFTNDLSRSIVMSESLEYGMVGINDTAVTVVEGPFGGIKESGMGREGGPGSLNDFLNTKLITITL